MLAAQFGHRLPGCVVQVPRAFIIHCDRKDPAIRHRIQILDQAFALLLGSVGVEPAKGRDSEDVASPAGSLMDTETQGHVRLSNGDAFQRP